MAGIYELRRDALSNAPERTLDLDRLVRKLREHKAEYVRFFRLNLKSSAFLCIVTEDASQAIASTVVIGSGVDPMSQAVGEIGEISTSDAIRFCDALLQNGWESARILSQALIESDLRSIPVWLASAEALAREFWERATEGTPQLRPAIDLERFSRELQQTVESQPIRVFHVFDTYGWHGVCALSGDQARAIGVMAIKK
ncbi:hypothetical protein ACFXEL_27760 [Streptomyces sp. NPDC059382]|uniref:hypothetical protein n=1 Tax=Streptomyces sp. NPDC059382 TaxID=3346816 RepID=UPI0036B6C0E5